MRSFQLKVLTPVGEAFAGEIVQINLRTTGGEVGILAGHTDYLAGVEICVVKLVENEENGRFAFCGGGFFSMTAGVATLVTDELVFADQLDEQAVSAEVADFAERLGACSDEQTKRFLTAELRRATTKKKAIEAQKELR